MVDIIQAANNARYQKLTSKLQEDNSRMLFARELLPPTLRLEAGAS